MIGRAHEIERLRELIERGGSLAVVGEPGIGKSALLAHAGERAQRTVLAATGSEAELALPYSGLQSLLRPVLHQVDALPAVQRRALEAALALAPPVSTDRLAVHAAALNVLIAAGHHEPLLLVVDDAHWVDPASAQTLLFVARRLVGESVGMLLGLRPAEGRRLDLSGVEQLTLAGLDRAAAAALLNRAAGATLPDAVVERLHEATEGNPLALLEAPAAVPAAQLAGREPLADPLPAGPGVQATYRRRLQRLAPRTRTALLLATAGANEPLYRLERAAGALGVTLADLGPAEAAGLLELEPDAVRFRHPLVRAAVYAEALVPDRRAVHAALADHTDGARRANHLWAAAAGCDDRAAAALEAAADDARARTGYASAALAAERAARLTIAPAQRARRLARAARDHLLIGESEHAGALAADAVTLAEEPLVRAEALEVLGTLELMRGSLDAAHERLSDAAAEASPLDPGRGAWLLASAAMAYFMAARTQPALATTERAYVLARQAGGTTEAIVGIMLGGARLIAGHDDGDGQRALLDRWPDAIDEKVLIPAAPHLAGSLQFLGWVERYAEAEVFAERVSALAAESGATAALAFLSGRLEIDLRCGRWDDARARTSEALRISDASGQAYMRSLPLTVLARLDAGMGLEASCRATVAELHGLAAVAGIATMRVYAEAALGLLELGLGRAERAIEHLDATARMCAEYGNNDPSTVPYGPDRVEALVYAGHLDRAHAALAEFEAQATRVRRSWPTAAAARCRGLLEDDFEPWFERAYAAHGPAASPFELARTELVHGERLRRARRMTEAREQLRSALERFEAVGAAPWAARTRAELRAAGGAVGQAQDHATRELTPQELEVALMVANGATNREVAATLFVSPKTVEAHLTRIFRKLGVRSRTQLARAVR